ncbi:MAG: sulfatase-like hydrolase/transferase [Alistipes sp.]|nr:sulfatase-like hydrolase/transferase [Alistipes senegalensis]MCM1250919.1 sulfatase-like hydrolase/transferase [Alistipes sp.]
MRRLLHTPLALLVRRIAVLYVILLLCRILFYVCNRAQLGPIGWEEVWPLLCGALSFDTASIVYADGIFILLSLLPFEFVCRRRYQQVLYWYYLVVNFLLIVVVNLADIVYFRYTQKRFTADEFFFADNDNSLLLLFRFMGENWPLLLAGVALTILLAGLYGRRDRCESILNPGWSYYTFSTLLLALAAGLCLAGVRGGVTRATRPITLSNAMLYTADPGKANLILSNPFCILRTIGHTDKIRYRQDFAPGELERLFTPEHRPEPRTAADSAARETAPADTARVSLRGRNVMIFIMESMSAEHSAHLRPDLYAGRPEAGFTPFLDSLMRGGLTFRRMYANGTRSIQAMPSVLGSIPSFKTPFVLMSQSLGESRQLPAILASQGYSTAFFCGSERGSMGFGAYARSAGIERLVSREDYEKAHGTGDFDGYWGIWDEEFLQFAGEELSAMPQPFFGTLFTLSSHHPFVVPERYAATLPDGYTRIHKGVAYDDMAMRRFFERFGNEEWFRRTLFVFVADHVSSEKFAPESREYPGSHHIVGFFYTPDGALRGEIDEVAQQLDIMPTILGLLENEEPYFAFGRDLLGEPERPRWSVSYDGLFRALTDRSVVEFDDLLPPDPKAGPQQRRLRALVQQYYSHIERKRYVVDD